jgi:FKBP12-rapamycin complex-associated protein
MLIPPLAIFDPKEFSLVHLHDCMLHLFNHIKREKEKGYGKIPFNELNDIHYTDKLTTLAFIAIGRVAMAVGSGMGPYLEAVVYNLQDGLSIKRLPFHLIVSFLK